MILNKALIISHICNSFSCVICKSNSVENPINDLETNGFGFIRILEYCKKFNVKKVLYSSSSCVYGNKIIMNENDTDLNQILLMRLPNYWVNTMQNFGHLIMDLMLSL